MEPEANVLYYGDNLVWLRNPKYFPDGFVDLIYLDPPFNSDADYNVIFKEPGGEQSQAQIQAFDDTWHWDRQASETALDDLGTVKPELVDLIKWVADRGDKESKSIAAYLSMMAVRLIELHRVLKSTGALYLHCDTKASHYLKMLLDTIFGTQNFRSEIIWRRTGYNSAFKRFGPLHQTIFFYRKTNATKYHPVMSPYTKGYIEEFFTDEDERGRYQSVALTGTGIRSGESGLPWRGYDPTKVHRHWQIASYLYSKYKQLTNDDLAKYSLLQQRLDKLDEVGLIHWGKKGTVPRYKYYLVDAPGVPVQDIWAYQPGTQGCVYGRPNECIDQGVKWLSTKDKERLGYPTQKPEGVLERIIRSSSKEGELVLDPFCGCGTTVAVAQQLNRRWVGIDVTWLAIDKIERRLAESFGKKVKYLVRGNPIDVTSARDLANRSKKEFEIWALSLVHAAQREHDGGVDGILSISEGNKKYTKVVVQVKGGEVLVPEMIRALDGTVTKEKAAMGLFISLEEPTTGMKETAVHYGLYKSPIWDKSYLRIQIRTIHELLIERKGFDLPPQVATLKQAERIKEQGYIEPML